MISNSVWSIFKLIFPLFLSTSLGVNFFKEDSIELQELLGNHLEWENQLELIEITKETIEDCPYLYMVQKVYSLPLEFSNGTKEFLEVGYQQPQLEEIQEFVTPVQTPYISPRTDVVKRYIPKHLTCLEQDDPKLIEYVREHMLDPPSTLPYNFKTREFPTGDGQPLMLDQRVFFEQKKQGFFVEAGAWNGEDASTTLYFERKHQWTGLLVEPVELPYWKLKDVHRKAWSSMTCLSSTTRPQVVDFAPMSSDVRGSGVRKEASKGTLEYFCLPLYTLLLAVGNTKVDYFSLDIEGTEFDVLNTIPWDKVEISVISVETEFFGTEDVIMDQKINRLLTSQGYFLFETLSRDDIYVKYPRPGLEELKPHLPLHWNYSPKVTVETVMTRNLYPLPIRFCVMLNVPTNRLSTHCREMFPWDFYRDLPKSMIADCIKRKACPADFASRINTYRFTTAWQTQLNDGCVSFVS